MTPLKTPTYKGQVLERSDPKRNPKLFNFIDNKPEKIKKHPDGTWTLWGKQVIFCLCPKPLPGGKTANMLKPCSLSVFTPGSGSVEMCCTRWFMGIPWYSHYLKIMNNQVHTQKKNMNQMVFRNVPLNVSSQPSIVISLRYMGVSTNGGTPKSSMFIGLSLMTIHVGVPSLMENTNIEADLHEPFHPPSQRALENG